MMGTLSRQDLLSLEQYAEERKKYRDQVIEHKKNRQLNLGEHITLYFEDKTTIQYQIQEMLRIERIFEPEAIQEELDSYNPLIPSGTNWKATCMIEYVDVEERKQALSRMTGIEHKIWFQINGFDRLYAIANEDLDRSNDDKTSAVHFLRFEFSQKMIEAIKSDANIAAGIDHPAYSVDLETLPGNIRQSLVADLS